MKMEVVKNGLAFSLIVDRVIDVGFLMGFLMGLPYMLPMQRLLRVVDRRCL